MGKVRVRISMSLDGFVAGPSQSLKDPIGVGGMRLHFVLTHHARAPLALEGGTTFHFVTEGPAAALDAARRAAGERDVMVAGGAKAAKQYLARGVVDQMDISLVPILLGAGERLFDTLGDDLRGLALVRTIVMNHTYHHRGQLSVYLRMLDVPVPSIYGPSADESPFAAPTARVARLLPICVAISR